MNFNFKDVFEFFNANKVVYRTKNRLFIIDMNKNETKLFSIKSLNSEKMTIISKLDTRKYQSLLFFSSQDDKLIIYEFELSINKLELQNEILLEHSCVIKKVFSSFLDESFRPYSLIVCENLKVVMVDLLVSIFNYNRGKRFFGHIMLDSQTLNSLRSYPIM